MESAAAMNGLYDAQSIMPKKTCQPWRLNSTALIKKKTLLSSYMRFVIAVAVALPGPLLRAPKRLPPCPLPHEPVGSALLFRQLF